MRVAATADLHVRRASRGELRPLFAEASRAADVLLLCGDLTDRGLAEEAETLADDAALALRIPAFAVLGNHDHEAGDPAGVARILARAGIMVLDGEGTELGHVGFAGVKGFAGGFGDRALGPWGEDAIKRFVREAVEEALKLETALATLTTRERIVLLHYAPIAATVEGEPPVVYPFLGSSRLEEPINRCHATAVFHGHAHLGQPDGRTSTDVPVFNVCLPLLRERFPDRPPFRLLEVPAP